MAKALLLLTGLILVFGSSCYGVLHPTATAIPARAKPSSHRKRHHNGHQPPVSSSFRPSPEDPRNWTPVISTTRPPMAGKKHPEFPNDSGGNSEMPAQSQLASDEEVVSVFFVSPITPLNSLQSSFMSTLMGNSPKSYTQGNVFAKRGDSFLGNSSQLQHGEKLAIPKKLAELFSKHAILAEASMSKLLQEPFKPSISYEAKDEVLTKMVEKKTGEVPYDNDQMFNNKRSTHAIHGHPIQAHDEVLEQQDVAESTYFPAQISPHADAEEHTPHFNAHSVPFSTGNAAYLPVRAPGNNRQHPQHANSFHSLHNPDIHKNTHHVSHVHRSEFDPSRSIFDTSDITSGNGGNSYRVFVPGITPLESLFEGTNPTQSPFPKHVLARIPGYVPPKGDHNKSHRPPPVTETEFQPYRSNQHGGFSGISEEHHQPTDLALEVGRQSHDVKSTTIPRIPGYVPPKESPGFRQKGFSESNRLPHEFHDNLPHVDSFSSVPQQGDHLQYDDIINGPPPGQEHFTASQFYDVPTSVTDHPTPIPFTPDSGYTEPSRFYKVPTIEFDNQNLNNIGFTKNEAGTLAQKFEVPSQEYSFQSEENAAPFHQQFNNLQNEFPSFKTDTFQPHGGPFQVHSVGEHSDIFVNEPGHTTQVPEISSHNTHDQISPQKYDTPGHSFGNSPARFSTLYGGQDPRAPNLHLEIPVQEYGRPIHPHVTHGQGYTSEQVLESPFKRLQTPSQEYGTPKRTYEPPSKEYGHILQETYNAPSGEYGAHQNSFEKSDPIHGNPHITSGTRGQEHGNPEAPSNHNFPQQSFVSHSQDFGIRQSPEGYNQDVDDHSSFFESPSHGHSTSGEAFNIHGSTGEVSRNFQSSHKQSHETSHQVSTFTNKDTGVHRDGFQIHHQFQGDTHGSDEFVHHQNELQTDHHAAHANFNAQNLGNDHSSQSPCPQSEYDPDGDCIRGEGFKDYPKFEYIQETGFTCADKVPGLYADEEAGCQVWHYCLKDGRKYSFICPIGTVFHQRVFTCDWWYNVDCSQTKEFYRLNEKLISE
ncbi:uncharacterized protein [Macrobrachium rosenbergii]|uniref:uncharacterized protein n=1 Tax=Macrobrachium rosenbergii TaxID=79674 RepID=UPI0034D49E96